MNSIGLKGACQSGERIAVIFEEWSVQGGFIVNLSRTFCTLITQNLQWGGLLSTYTNGFQSLISHQWTSFCEIPKGLCSTVSNHLTNFIYLKLKLILYEVCSRSQIQSRKTKSVTGQYEDLSCLYLNCLTVDERILLGEMHSLFIICLSLWDTTWDTQIAYKRYTTG